MAAFIWGWVLISNPRSRNSRWPPYFPICAGSSDASIHDSRVPIWSHATWASPDLSHRWGLVVLRGPAVCPFWLRRLHSLRLLLRTRRCRTGRGDRCVAAMVNKLKHVMLPAVLEGYPSESPVKKQKTQPAAEQMRSWNHTSLRCSTF